MVISFWLVYFQAVRVGEEFWIHGSECFTIDSRRVIAIFFVISLLEAIMHGIDSGFALVVAVGCSKIIFLHKEQYGRSGKKKHYDDYFNDSKPLRTFHMVTIVAYNSYVITVVGGKLQNNV